MRILLIQPPLTIYRSEEKSCQPPLGLAYIGAALRGSHDLCVLDAIAEGFGDEQAQGRDFISYGLPSEVIKDRIRDYYPDIVGVSWPFTNQSEHIHNICAIVKAIDKKIITIVGGTHPSALPQEALGDSNIDYAVIGEGEYSVKSLLQEIEQGKKALSTEGIAYRRNGDIIINPKRDYIKELDSLAFPYWEIFPLEKYFKINRPHGGSAKRASSLPMITSRGCPYQCIFCSIHNIWGRSFRKRSPENVLSEIEHLNSKFGAKEIMFEDDNLTLEKERCRRIFEGMVERNLDLVWLVPNGMAIDTIDEKMLSLMKDSGCYSLSIAVESGDEYVLKQIIKKPLQLARVRPLVEKAKKLRLEVSIFFVVGLPGEQRRHIKNTFSFARKLRADNINFFFATPLPGTELNRICRERGFISNSFNYRYLKSNKPSFATKDFTQAQLQTMVLREKIILYLLSLFVNPKRFIAKLLGKLKDNPGFIFKFASQYFKIGIFAKKEKKIHA